MALDLDAIEQRQRIALLGPGHVEPLLVREDVPALIAEVREVTRQRDDAAARLKSLLVLLDSGDVRVEVAGADSPISIDRLLEILHGTEQQQ